MPRIGLGLGMGTAIGGRRWTPAAISGLIFQADWTSQVFSDAGFTVPSSADGDDVRRWTDTVGARHFTADGAFPDYKPTGGPSVGKFGVLWDGAVHQPAFNASGSSIIAAGQSVTMVVIVKNSGASGRSGICGRGGFNNEGFTLHFDASNRIIGTVRTVGNTTLTEPVGVTGTWQVAMLTYDGANCLLIVRGGTPQIAAKTGNLAFADAGFAVGGLGSSGAYAFNANGGKTVGGVYVTTTTYDATTGAALLNQFASYAGIP